ncbi:MAG: endo-1,4-beta-xylanase [Treponema sp.]|nr:endo-1,4-beta-xylanase [Treponema sp.]
MKKIILAALSALALIFTSCQVGSNDEVETNSYTEPDVTVSGATLEEGAFAYISYNLAEYAGKAISVDLTAEMKVINNGESAANLMWQLTDVGSYPIITSKSFPAGTSDWVKVTTSSSNAKNTYTAGADTVLYLSTYGTTPSDLEIQLRNVEYKITSSALGGKDWMDESVPSIKETYSDTFEYFGIACENNSKELANENTRKGIAKHANSITMGNEFKPDGFFGWGFSGETVTLVDFTDSTGKKFKVPETLNYSTVDACLAACKEMGVKMRGHVLTWHSQTPDAFYAENWIADVTTTTDQYGRKSTESIKNLVDKETMTARHEWYIKTVLNHVAEWEAENDYRAIWAWDVVNEAMADDSGNTYTGSNQNWLRGSTNGTKNKGAAAGGSFWYQIYGNEEFIINAFRFANAYAPSDVKLCYNDYNEYMNYNGGYKTDAILHLIDLLQSAEAKTINGNSVKPRIDAMGMQSHVDVEQPFPKVSDYEAALKKFLNKLDVHVTELDIVANTKSSAKTGYSDYFKMLKKYGKNYSGSHKITCVTVWGINNGNSWITYKSKFPLLFNNNRTTDSFNAVIDAHNK